MATQALDLDQLDLSASRRTLVLVWQNPMTRRFAKVGQLDAMPEGRVAFHYLASAWEDDAFVPLLEYPDPAAAYVSNEVPAFFANRILSADRPNYDSYLRWLGIADVADADVPFEVLARTGGARATDTFHVVDLPVEQADGFASRFFVSGVRHADPSGASVGSLQDGERLQLASEPGNPKNPKAVLVASGDGRKVGYVPDWLCADVHGRIEDGWTFSAIAERVNVDAPPHVRVLCRLDARPGASPS